MWSLYDELIANIPDNITVEDYYIGKFWTMVKTSENVGTAMTICVDTRKKNFTGNIINTSLKTIAGCAKSWNFLEASIGVAAINVYYNSPCKIQELKASDSILIMDNAFDVYQNEMRGKNIAIIGHFPYIEKKLGPICNLSILERQPQSGDFPDSACEYILSDQDFVFITGSTLINKTLPRLLQISSKHAKVILVGPSVTLSPLLYQYGVFSLSGFYIDDADLFQDIITLNKERDIFCAGTMINFENNRK